MSEVVEYSPEWLLSTSDYLPDWTYRAIVEDLLPWQAGRTCSFDEFEKTYTLHDSSWIGLFAGINLDSNVTLSIIWDPFWMPDEVHRSTSIVKEWPLLFIKIRDVQEIDISKLAALDYGRTICGAEFGALDDDLSQLIVVCDGGEVRIKFTGETVFLGLDREAKPLKL